LSHTRALRRECNDHSGEDAWETGIRDLYRATESDGTFCYTFFKGVGKK
jgi:hypothetical protein